MSGKNYYFIDNFADGNCGYLAYAISLMYALRHANDDAMAGRIFDDKLGLEREDSQYLKGLLATSRAEKRAFNKEELDEIQRKLGQPLRNFAADSSVNEYLKKTRESHIFAVANFPMIMAFKDAIEDDDIKAYKPAAQVSDLNQAELFKLRSFIPAVEAFYQANKESFVELYTEQLDSHESETLTAQDKIDIFNDLVEQQTIAFFKDNDMLEQYKEHLKISHSIWASEETILCMHRAIVNEYRHEDHEHLTKDLEPTITWKQENPLTFDLARDGVKVNLNDAQILLNNQHNIHWTSYIPEDLLSDIPLDKRPIGPKYTLSSFAKAAVATSAIHNTTFNPDVDHTTESDIKQQKALLEHYAKQRKAKQPENDQKPITETDLEQERKHLSYLKLVEGQRQNPIAAEVKILLSEQEKIRDSLRKTNEELSQLEAKIKQKDVSTKETMEQLHSKHLAQMILAEEKGTMLKENTESVMRLLAIEEAEHNVPPLSPKYDKVDLLKPQSSKKQEPEPFSQPTNEPTETEPSVSGCWMLEMLLFAAKNTAILSVAILAGIGVGLIVASTGVGIPAAIGLGVSTTAVTGIGLLSFFNHGSGKEASTVQPERTVEHGYQQLD